MTEAQEAAMRQLAESKLPMKLHAGTALALERRTLVEQQGDGYVITEGGRRHLLHEQRSAEGKKLDQEFRGDLRERLEKVLEWLKFTGRLQFPYRARPLIQALLLGRSDFSLHYEDQQAEDWVRGEIESAIQIVGEYLEAQAEAVRIGGSVGVSIQAEKPNPVKAKRRRTRDVEDAADEHGAVSLTRYRKRRKVMA